MSKEIKGVVTKFVSVSPEYYDRFNQMREEDSNIVPCDLYVNKYDGKVYFVEKPRGLRSKLELYEDYLGDISIDDNCKAISSMGL